MDNYIEWQQFEELNLKVINNDFFESVTLTRDKNYNILFKINCKKIEQNQPYEVSDISSFFISKLNNITATSIKCIGKSFTLNGFVVEKFNLSIEDKHSFEGILLHLESSYIIGNIGDPEFINVWLLNSPNDANFDVGITRSGSNKQSYQWGDFAKDEFCFDNGTSLSWAGIKMKYKSYDFLFIKADTFTKSKTSFLRFEKKQFPTNEVLDEIICILDFIFGMTFIYIGNTKYNKASSPVSDCYLSSYRKDIEQILIEAQYPVIPLRLIDFHQFQIPTTELINKIFENILKKSKFTFRKNFELINYARTQPAEVKIQPLAASFDNICEQYYKGIDNNLIAQNIFSDLQSLIHKQIDSLDITEEQKRILKSKTPQINNQSQNQRNKKIFNELGLKLGKLEKKALDARNRSVHGGFDSTKINEIILLSRCYYTLINRLILKILDIPLYIDYTHPNGLPMKIEEAQNTWMEKILQNEDKKSESNK